MVGWFVCDSMLVEQTAVVLFLANYFTVLADHTENQYHHDQQQALMYRTCF